LRAIGGRSPKRQQAFLFGPHRARNFVDFLNRVVCVRLAQHRKAARSIVAFNVIDDPCEFVQPTLDLRPQLFAFFDLKGIIAGQVDQLVDGGKNTCDRRLVLGEKAGLTGQKIPARSTFGGAYLQQQG